MKASTILGFVAAFGTALAAPSGMAKREPKVDVGTIPVLQPLVGLIADIQISVGIITTEVGNLGDIGTTLGSGMTSGAAEQVEAAVPKIKTQLVLINSSLKKLPGIKAGGPVGVDGAAAALDVYAQLFDSISTAMGAVGGLDANRIGRNNFNMLTGILSQVTSSLGLGLNLDGLLDGIIRGIL
ncbi:hypothetical protein RB595_000905 [Gaeumannomyces hyphopodioides]